MHSMITGLFRFGRTIGNMVTFLPIAFEDPHDIEALTYFGQNFLSHLYVDNAFVKFGQLQLEYQEVRQFWMDGQYKEAGARVAEDLVDLVEYKIHFDTRHHHYWPFSLMQPIVAVPPEQKAGDLVSGLMIGLT